MKTLDKIQNSKSSLVRELASNGYVRTGHYTGSGRHTRSVSNQKSVMAMLEELGINYAYGNDAPRGGVSGEYIVLTSLKTLREIGADMKVCREMIKNGNSWTKPHKLTKEVLNETAEKAISWTEKNEDGYGWYVDKGEGTKFYNLEKDDNRYWLNCYHGCGVYELIIVDKKIVGSIYGGFHGSIRTKFGYETPNMDQWMEALKAVIERRIGNDYKFIKADGSGTYFFARNWCEDSEFVNTKEYDVPDLQNGGLHHNAEIY